MSNWRDILRAPAGGDHMVQVYKDRAFLAAAVAEYIGAGLADGDGAIIIARPQHRQAFREALWERDLDFDAALDRGQLVLRDAGAALEQFMRDGMPQWAPFREAMRALFAQVRSFPAVRAYGEMVDMLWQNGQHDAAVRLEGFWNDLAKEHSFSLLCGYRLDHLDDGAYGGPLECLCKVHSHLIPTRDYQRFDDAVTTAARKVLDDPMLRMLLAMSSIEKPAAQMPAGQAMLLWMQENMPATAKRVLAEVRASAS